MPEGRAKSDVNLNKKIVEEILRVLDGSIWGMTIEEISRATGRHRNTIAKYMPALERMGLVVSKIIGKYTFWLPFTVFRYRYANIPKIFIRALSKVLKKFSANGTSPTPREVGEEVGKILTTVDISAIREGKTRNRWIPKNVEYMIGMFIPTIVPGVRYRIDELNLRERRIRITVDNCPCDGDPESRSVCEFIHGLIRGALLAIGFLVTNSKEISCRTESGKNCVFEFYY
ncbi:MAG: hypothetical protein ACTSXX_10845 [Candidatus Baldrarchaeia archaeon]